MKNNIIRKAIVSGVLALTPVMVSAKSANVSLVSKDTFTNNDVITLNIKVDNIDDVKDGIVAVGGDVVYNPEYLTFVSATPASSPYNFDGNFISNGDYRIAGVDFTLENGIKNDTMVYTLTFKANKVGETTISFNNAELVDVDANDIDATTTNKTINIIEEKIVENVIENKEIVNETTNKVNNPTPIIEKFSKKDIVKENNKVSNNIKEETKEINEVKEEVKKQDNENNDNIISIILKSIANIFKSIFGFLN